MKITITKNVATRVLLALASLLIAGYMFTRPGDNSLYNNYYYVPLLFAVCVLLSKNYDLFDLSSPGTLVLKYTMIMKYMLMPIIMHVGGYHSWLGTMPNSGSVSTAIIFTIIEMIFVMAAINILSSRGRAIAGSDKHVAIKPQSKGAIYKVLIILGLMVVVLLPETIADYRFLFNTDNLAENIKVDFDYSGLLKTIVVFSRYAAVLLIINYFHKRNINRKSKINIVGAFIPVVLNCLFTPQLSRITIFVPVLIFSTIIFIIFNDKNERKMIARVFLALLLGSLVFMSALKFFGEGRGNEDRSQDIGWWGDTLNMYFSGPKETAIGVEAERIIDDRYGNARWKLLLNDMSSNVVGLSNIADDDNTSTVLYNLRYFSSSIAVCQIVPNIIEGYYYFGLIFCWIWPCIFVFLCFYFDKKSKKMNTIYMKFPYLYASVYCGMILMINTSMIIANIINVSLLFIIVSAINMKLKFAREEA